MPRMDLREWNAFWKVWDRKLETLPGAKKAALLQSGLAVQSLLHSQISHRINDSRGRVKRWQEVQLGSGGGYSAVAPSTSVVGFNKVAGRKITAKNITQYLEHGHKIRPPSGRRKRYRWKVKAKADTNKKHNLYTVVPGRMFYSWTKADAPKVAVRAARGAILEWINDFAGDEE